MDTERKPQPDPRGLGPWELAAARIVVDGLRSMNVQLGAIPTHGPHLYVKQIEVIYDGDGVIGIVRPGDFDDGEYTPTREVEVDQ